MKLTTTLRALLVLLLFFATAQVAQGTDYASILASADWNWQERDGVTYGRTTFTDLYGSAQAVAIAKYSSAAMSTMLFDKEHSSQGTNSLAIEAGAAVAINGSYFNMSTYSSTTAV